TGYDYPSKSIAVIFLTPFFWRTTMKIEDTWAVIPEDLDRSQLKELNEKRKELAAQFLAAMLTNPSLATPALLPADYPLLEDTKLTAASDQLGGNLVRQAIEFADRLIEETK